MPLIDFAIILLVIWAIYKGWQQGFLKELFSMAGFLVGLLIAAGLYSSLGEKLVPQTGMSPTIAKMVAFVLIWVIVPILLGLVANLLTKALKGLKIGLPNSILGAAVSLIKYTVLMSCVFNVMSFLGIISPAKASASLLYEPIKNSLGYAFNKFSNTRKENKAIIDTVIENDTGKLYIITRDTTKKR